MRSLTSWHKTGKLRWKLEFNPSYWWIGINRGIKDWRYSTSREIFICLLPTLSLHLRWTIRQWEEFDFEPDPIGEEGPSRQKDTSSRSNKK